MVAAIAAYGVGGYAYAQTRLNTADDAYNTVVDHQNSLTVTIDALGTQVNGANLSSSANASIQQYRDAMTQIVTKSQQAQPEIQQDDANLAAADAGLKQNQWLTVLSRSRLDKASTRIGHARKALADAKTITSDYVQIGTFYESLFDMLTDINNLASTAQSSDFAGAAAADEKLKSDTAKAITRESAPGLPPETDTLLKGVQTVATDFREPSQRGGQGRRLGGQRRLENAAGRFQQAVLVRQQQDGVGGQRLLQAVDRRLQLRD